MGGYLAYLLWFLVLAGLVLKLLGVKRGKDPMAGVLSPRGREYRVYLLYTLILPTIEGSAVGAREGSV